MSQDGEGRTGRGRWRIGINAQLLAGQAGYRRAGIHHYLAKTLENLQLNDLDAELIIYSRFAEGIKTTTNRRIARSRWPTEQRLVRIIWEQFAWPVLMRRDRIDLMHSTAFVLPAATRLPAIVTIYDLSFVHYPRSFPRLQQHYLQAQTEHASQRARRIVTISKASGEDVQRVYGVPADRISVVRPGVDSRYRPLPCQIVSAFRQEQKLPERFILHVGTLQPRKNIPVLLDALSLLPRQDRHLVLVGGKGWFTEDIERRIRELGLVNDVRFAGYVADEQLPLYYNAASLVVVPSLYEGFGLPVAEGLACGVPVVAARASSLPEAGGTAARYFEPASADSLAGQLAAVLGDEKMQKEMRNAGPAQASRFSWQEAGRQLGAVYREVLAEL